MEDTQEASFRNGVDGKAVVVGAVVPFAGRLIRAGRGVKTIKNNTGQALLVSSPWRFEPNFATFFGCYQ